MIILISPAKNIDFDKEVPAIQSSEILFEKEAKKLLTILKTYSANDLASLMKISSKLAQLNFERFQAMQFPFLKEEIKPALLVFNGDVFQGMDVPTFTTDDLYYAQQKLRILSGFYGLLRPLDGIQPYRLEMGTSLKTSSFSGLYDFWENKLQKQLKQHLAEDDGILVNLASNEYFKSVQPKSLKNRIITPIFLDYNNGKYKQISFYAKKARGMMTAYILKSRITNVEDIKLFDMDGYSFNDPLSKGDEWVFTRG